MHSIYTPNAGRWAWISLIGPDAKDFLQRLTTVNVRELEVGHGARGCFLTAQGKLRAYFTLWNYRPSEYAFEVDTGTSGEWKTSLLAAIDQYTFAEQMTLADVTQIGTRWIFAEPSQEADLLTRLGVGQLQLNPMETVAVEEEIRLCYHGAADYGRPWISVWGRPERLRQWMDRVLPDATTLDEPALETMRIHSLRPKLGAELTPETIPLEAGLIDAIAQFKGCYPGQEVIERIVSLGAPARRLCLIEGKGKVPTPGTRILNEAEPPAEVGEISSAVAAGDGFAALGFLRKIHAKEGLGVRFSGNGAAGKVQRIAPYAPTES